MNLKEKLKAKAKELKELMATEAYKNGEAEAIKSGEELTAAIEEINAAIAAAQKANDILNTIGNDDADSNNGDTDAEEKASAKSLGENFVKFAKKATHGKKFDVVAPEFKAASDVQTIPAGISAFATDLDKNVVTAVREALVIRNLFGAETISGNALTYLVEGAQEGNAAVTKEGAKKAQIHFADPTPVTVSLKKLTAFIKESDEYIADYPFLASAINGRLLYALQLKEQNQLVADLIATSGIQTDTTGFTASTGADALANLIFGAMMDVQTATGYAADAIVLAPKTWQLLRLGQDKNGAYYGGGYFADAQGKQLWGIPVVTSTAVTADQIIVGAFKTCGSVVTKGGITVESTNSDEDDFTKNLMTIRAEERLALAVRRPAGFKLITKASA